MQTTKVNNSSYAPRASSASVFRTADQDGFGYKAKAKAKKYRRASQPLESEFNGNPEVIIKTMQIHNDHTKDLLPLETRKFNRKQVVEEAKNDVARAMERIGKIQYYG